MQHAICARNREGPYKQTGIAGLCLSQLDTISTQSTLQKAG
jgi:hypothetical protein